MTIVELSKSIGIPVEFIAFERGIVVRPVEEKWLVNACACSEPLEIHPDDIAKHCLPVMVRCRSYTSENADFIVHPTGSFVPPVQSIGGIDARISRDIMALEYIFGALAYHVGGIVCAYERVCMAFATIQRSFKNGSQSDTLFQNMPEPYYEFDALASVIRRSYDVCRYPLFKLFSSQKSGMPHSLEKVLPLCDKLDDDLRDSLSKSWRVWGKLVTEYRDCIHHYVPLDFGISSIVIKELIPNVWSAFTRIPDNPMARSKAQFTFKQELDALTFGWRAACEAMRVMGIVDKKIREST